jgi:hypothetical protein
MKSVLANTSDPTVLNVECLFSLTPLHKFWMLNVFVVSPISRVLNVECLCRHTPIAQSFECWMSLQTHTHCTSFECWMSLQTHTFHQFLLLARSKPNIYIHFAWISHENPMSPLTYERVGEAWVVMLFACKAEAAAHISHEIQCLHSWESWWGPSSNNLLICQW